MAYSTSITVAQALSEVNNAPFPQVAEGDYIWWPGGKPGTDMGHRFRYDGSAWVSDPADMLT